MILKRALVEPTNCGFMLNECKADVLPDEAVGVSERRNTTERKIADPNPCQIVARGRCTLGSRRAAHERCDDTCAQEPDATGQHDFLLTLDQPQSAVPNPASLVPLPRHQLWCAGAPETPVDGRPRVAAASHCPVHTRAESD
jgi:hypothetical protein